MSTTSTVSGILTDVEAQGQKWLATPSEDLRHDLVRKVRQLYLELETPIETTLRIAWAEKVLDSCLQIALDLNLFKHMSESVPRSSAELAAATSSDPRLLVRILRHLAATDYLRETSPEHYVLTKFTKVLTLPEYADAIPLHNYASGPVNAKLPEFLKRTSYRNPSDPSQGPFQFGHNVSSNVYTWLGENPELGIAFNNHMRGYALERKTWIDPGCYPVQERVINGSDPEGVLLVDVAGGSGRDVNSFRGKFGGKCVLQDQPAVVKGADCDEGIQVQAHDIFTPQPVQGARAYFLHSILHNWSDVDCVRILKNIIPAMKPGYSKILINEHVITASDPYWMTTGMDIIMMNMFATAERSEDDWRKLIEGDLPLKVTGIWQYEKGTQGLIEVELTTKE